MIDLREVTQGGPFNGYGGRLYWDGVLVHVLRSHASESGLRASAAAWAKQMCCAPHTPESLRSWSLGYGSLSPECDGERFTSIDEVRLGAHDTGREETCNG